MFIGLKSGALRIVLLLFPWVCFASLITSWLIFLMLHLLLFLLYFFILGMPHFYLVICIKNRCILLIWIRVFYLLIKLFSEIVKLFIFVVNKVPRNVFSIIKRCIYKSMTNHKLVKLIRSSERVWVSLFFTFLLII